VAVTVTVAAAVAAAAVLEAATAAATAATAAVAATAATAASTSGDSNGTLGQRQLGGGPDGLRPPPIYCQDNRYDRPADRRLLSGDD
jgi:hypothetical protein